MFVVLFSGLATVTFLSQIDATSSRLEAVIYTVASELSKAEVI